MNGILITAPSHIHTHIDLPSSKSISNRALIIHTLAHGENVLSRLSDCDDTRVMIEALLNMPQTIDIGAAGTAMRFLTAYLCTLNETHILTGSERMRHRPIEILVNALRALGADITYTGKEGYPPLCIKGGSLHGGEISLNGDVSSQYISALLLVAPSLQNGLQLHLEGNIVSKPYINLTLQLMHDFGAKAYWTEENHIVVEPISYKDISYSVESDWSAASYWYEIAALCPDASISLSLLSSQSYQGDSRIASVFERLGVHTTYTDAGVSLSKNNEVTSFFQDDFSDIPDLAQTIVCTCALLHIPFRIKGLQTLKIKETDRIEALKTELRKLGFILKDEENSILTWDGSYCKPEETPIIETYEDHRMAMSLAAAAFCTSNLSISNPQVVKKSYVDFWNDLSKSGFKIIQISN